MVVIEKIRQGFGINEAWGGMKIYDEIRKINPDFFLHSGDNIYADGPISAEVNLPDGPQSERGKPLIVQDEEARIAIDALHGKIDTNAALVAWEEALRVPQWDGRPVWIHGDLMPGNLLIKNNRLSAVIDFSCLGVGDPAIDLIIAWNLLPAHSREIFRRELHVNDATWARGRGWALSMCRNLYLI